MVTRPNCPECGVSKSYRNRPEGFRTWRPCGHVTSRDPEHLVDQSVAPLSSSARDEEPVPEEYGDSATPIAKVGIFEIGEGSHLETVVSEIAEVIVDDQDVEFPEDTLVSDDPVPEDILDVIEFVSTGEVVMTQSKKSDDLTDAVELLIAYVRRLNRMLTTGALANATGNEARESLSYLVENLPDTVGGKQIFD